MVIIKTSADEVSIHAVSRLSIFGGAAGAAAGAACWGGIGATPVCGGVCAFSCAPIVSGESRQTIRAMRSKRHWILGCTIDPPRILCVEFEQRDLTGNAIAAIKRNRCSTKQSTENVFFTNTYTSSIVVRRQRYAQIISNCSITSQHRSELGDCV